MAERIWEDQQSSDLELSRMSACKFFFFVELLHQGLQTTFSHDAPRGSSVPEPMCLLFLN
eukprot:35552-Pelagomonas_calceolata.AAC.1